MKYVQRIMDMLDFSLKENPKLTTVIPLDLIKYIVLPYISYTPLDFYHVTIDQTPCLYQSFENEIYEKIPTSLKTFEDLDELAKTLDRQFLIREGYLYPEEDDLPEELGRGQGDEIDPSLDDRGNLCARFKYEVGYLIRLTPKYKSVSHDHFELRMTPPETITLNYPEGTSFEDHVCDVMQPVYRRVYKELNEYNEQVMRFIVESGFVQSNPYIFCLSVKCLTHLRCRPGLNNLMTMIINDPEMLKIVKEEGIELVCYDEDEQ